MKLYSTIILFALAKMSAVYAAGFNGIPGCAVNCFTEAVGNSSCSLLDFYCQCTKGAKVINELALPCLCQDSTCKPADLLQVQKASNKICSSALSASSQTYTPTPPVSNVCKALATASSNSTITASNPASPTASAANAASSSDNAAAPTNAGLLGYDKVVLGIAGMALLAL